MSAQSLPFQDVSSQHPLTVSFRLLLGLYLIIPICLLSQFFDVWFLQGYLKSQLPTSPGHYLLFQVLFGTPHILASAILLFSNAEYIRRFQNKVLLMTLAVAVIFGVGSALVPYRALYILVAGWTVLHVLKQQHGAARGVCRLPAWAYHLMLWQSVVAGFFIYIGIYLKNSFDVQQTEWLQHIAGGCCVALVCTAVLCQRYAQSILGKSFMWANVFLVLSSFYLYSQGYYFLAILVPRLVHDGTAYIFYVTHDYNKHRLKPQNFIYRLAKFGHLPIVVMLPGLSFLLTFLLQVYGDATIAWLGEHLFGVPIRRAVTLVVLGYLALLHYYTESFTWKQGSPYRQFIAFSK